MGCGALGSALNAADVNTVPVCLLLPLPVCLLLPPAFATFLWIQLLLLGLLLPPLLCPLLLLLLLLLLLCSGACGAGACSSTGLLVGWGKRCKGRHTCRIHMMSLGC